MERINCGAAAGPFNFIAAATHADVVATFLFQKNGGQLERLYPTDDAVGSDHYRLPATGQYVLYLLLKPYNINDPRTEAQAALSVSPSNGAAPPPNHGWRVTSRERKQASFLFDTVEFELV